MQGTLEELIASMDRLSASIASLEGTISSTNLSLAGGTPKALTPIPADAVNIVIMGMRGHGQKHIDNFLKMKDVHISYVCDVDSRVGNEAADKIESTSGRRPKVIQDLRDALGDKSVDAVSIATPHHWHALAAIWALQAGKHVYIEKPITHNYHEGASILAAAEKYSKVVQAGTQLRSNTSLAAAAEYMQSGQLGKVDLVHCVTYKQRPAMPNKKVGIPKTVDYDIWCGPAEKLPPERGKFHYHWHWMWDYGNGALGNNGVHRIDVARIGLDLEGLGDSVLSFGGRYGEEDTGETPNTHIAVHKFDDTWVVQEVYGLDKLPPGSVTNGIVFHGTEGKIIYTAGKARLLDSADNEIKVFAGKQQNHYRNFVDAVKKNDPAYARGDLHEGNLSSALCHFANISYRVGETASDAQIMALLDQMDAPDNVKAFLDRARENLTENGVTDDMCLGELLLIDEQNLFVDHPEAEKLLGRTYREPFVVPAPADV